MSQRGKSNYVRIYQNTSSYLNFLLYNQLSFFLVWFFLYGLFFLICSYSFALSIFQAYFNPFVLSSRNVFVQKCLFQKCLFSSSVWRTPLITHIAISLALNALLTSPPMYRWIFTLLYLSLHLTWYPLFMHMYLSL